METAVKRPLSGVKEDSESRPKRQRAEAEAGVDADVEAFFAILRRMRDAARFFGDARLDRNGNGNGRGGERGLWRWKPAFEWEDFKLDPLPAVKDDGGRRTAGVFDLNAEPEPEPEQEGGEVTGGEASLRS